MKKILVIEDDAPLCWLLEKILSQYEVVIMSNGLEAWCWLTEGNSPDLIISDIKMPSLDGVELLENLSNSGLFKDIPVIMLSGFEDAAKRKKCMDLGAFTYLVKPFEPRLLIEIVEQALSTKTSPQHA